MKEISITLGAEEAIFSWKEGKVYCEGYDLESERAVLALTSFGEGIGVLLVASNECCKSEAEFMSEIEAFVTGHEELVASNFEEDHWPEGEVLFEYFSYSPDPTIRWGSMEDVLLLSENHYQRLLKDPDTDIKVRMASLYELPEKYFHALAKLSNTEINWALIDNKKSPIDVIEILAKDKDERVRLAAQVRLERSRGIWV